MARLVLCWMPGIQHPETLVTRAALVPMAWHRRFTSLMRRLDYLRGLGITAIWLMPCQVSPRRDDGYDVSDHHGVDPRYGESAILSNFTHGVKQRCIRVLIDRTLSEHLWIQFGVSGFRMAAVPFVLSTKGPNVSQPKEPYDMLRGFREFPIGSGTMWNS